MMRNTRAGSPRPGGGSRPGGGTRPGGGSPPGHPDFIVSMAGPFDDWEETRDEEARRILGQ